MKILYGICGEGMGHATRSQVHDWCCPVQENYEKLVSLFPGLIDAPRPRVRAIDKPAGYTSARRESASPRVVLADAPTSVTTPSPTPPSSQQLNDEVPMPAQPMSAPAQPMPSATKLSMIAWGKLVFRDGEKHAQVLALLRAARTGGLTIDDVIAALEDP